MSNLTINRQTIIAPVTLGLKGDTGDVTLNRQTIIAPVTLGLKGDTGDVTPEAAAAALACAEAVIATGEDRAQTGEDRTATGLDRIATGEDREQTGEDRVQTGLDRIATGEDKEQTAEDRIQTGLDRIATGEDKAATAADRVQTSLDRTATGEDREQTGLDRIATGEDREQTGEDRVQTDLDRTQTGEDREQTGLDRVATGEDKAQTGLDRVATGEDRVQTGLDRVATGEDRTATGEDKAATAADRVQTGEDKAATAADRVQTGLDRIQTGEDRTQTGEDAAATGENLIKAQAWAEAAEGVEVELGRYSARHHALQAASDAASAAADRAAADESAGAAIEAAADAQDALADAVAIVYAGEASTTPGAGKIPVAAADGRIDHNWIRTSLTPAPGQIPAAGDDGRISPDWLRRHDNDIGTPGGQGFGVGICPEVPDGMVELAGTRDPASDNYGNYQYSDGSIMCWVPQFFYKYGDDTNDLAVNSVDIRPASAYASLQAAHADGYTIHRAFYDGGVVQPGFFVDKYMCSNNAGTASSIKNAPPLSSHSVHNPFSDLTGSHENRYHGAFTAAKTRGNRFHPTSIFVHGALAMLSLAHGQATSSATFCAWYDAAGIRNFPKGCNNNALGDIDDSSVSYTSDGYSNCGLTGSGSPFAKTTHNGQHSGVADVNGNMRWICPGITTLIETRDITGISQTNPVEIKIAQHGWTAGDLVRTYNINGPTALNDKIYRITVIDPDTIALAGVDGAELPAWISGGTVMRGQFFALNLAAEMHTLTEGNSSVSDHWGSAGIAAQFHAIDPALATNYPGNGFAQRYGAGPTQVLSSDVAGNGWEMAGAKFPSGGISTSGTNMFGVDMFYQYITTDLCLIVGGYWSYGSRAGVWELHLYNYRRSSLPYVGFRAALYL